MHRRSFLAGASGFGAASLGGQIVRFNEASLRSFAASIERSRTASLLIWKDGETVLEQHAAGRTAASRHSMASAAKALVGGTSLLVAMNDGRIRPNEPASKYIEAWRADARKSKITIRHLATHTSGLEDSSVPGIVHPNEPGWKGRFWKREPDPFTISIHEAPLLFDPGAGYQYSNPGMAALAYCVTAALRGAPQGNIETLLRERVMRPIGVSAEEWAIGYGRAYSIGDLELFANWGGSNFSPSASVRVAEWMMRGGEWNGRPQVRRSVVTQLLKYAGMRLPDRAKDPYAPASALCWYTNFDAVWPAVPRDAFAAAGAGHQIVLIVPSLRLIVVRNGAALGRDGEPFWTPVYRDLFEPLMAALGNPAAPLPLPYPRSSVIRGVEFAPVDSIVRQAVECDNWPMTWADNGSLYTSYGDGYGFEPHIPVKLGMGFAKIDGDPADLRAVNIRSASGERTGDGSKSPKASGMVMIGGVLYMWVRNTGNAQLVWSPDRARTWNWGFKIERGFGSPAFLNYGKNYAGARDEYAYAYSQQGPSAYEIDDGVVLARAHTARLRDREAWQFASGFNSKGRPGWSRDPSEARPVFRYAKHVQRVDALFHPVLKRYLLAVSYGHNGGWGIYEAPEPWGPWATAFHTEYWGLGETHGYRLAPKWISEDGRSMSLVFSGLIYDGVSYDAFCVRGMRLL